MAKECVLNILRTSNTSLYYPANTGRLAVCLGHVLSHWQELEASWLPGSLVCPRKADPFIPVDKCNFAEGNFSFTCQVLETGTTRGGIYMFTLIVCTALFNVMGEHPSLKCLKPSVKDDHFLLEKMIKNDCVHLQKFLKDVEFTNFLMFMLISEGN